MIEIEIIKDIYIYIYMKSSSNLLQKTEGGGVLCPLYNAGWSLGYKQRRTTNSNRTREVEGAKSASPVDLLTFLIWQYKSLSSCTSCIHGVKREGGGWWWWRLVFYPSVYYLSIMQRVGGTTMVNGVDSSWLYWEPADGRKETHFER